MMLVHNVRHLEVEAPQVVFLDSPVEFWGTEHEMMGCQKSASEPTGLFTDEKIFL